MNNASLEELAHLKSEKSQILLRFFVVLSIVFTLSYYDSHYLDIEVNEYIDILDIFILFLILNFLNYLTLLKYPYKYQFYRITIAAGSDVVASAYVMYLVGDVSLYYTVLFLWYMIGYGLRYGKRVAYIVYFIVLASWITLINTSEFWIEHSAFAYSWLITYAILPPYSFHLVHKLQRTVLDLHKGIEKSRYQATHDPLTKLPNRTSFEKKLLTMANEVEKFALLFIDIDEFKKINDNHGHHIGDSVLQEFAYRVSSFKYYTARLSGDEFVTLIEYTNVENLKEKVAKILKKINQRCQIDDIKLSASIGVSLFPKDSRDLSELKKKSDYAMYKSKNSGKNTFVFYDEINKML